MQIAKMLMKAGAKPPIDPTLCRRLEGLDKLLQWEAFLAWLNIEKEDCINTMKMRSFANVEEAALTASACSAILKQIGRIETLPTVVSKVLEAFRDEHSSSH